MVALLTLSMFTFAGGTTPQLAAALASQAGKPVAILSADMPKLRASKFDWQNGKDVRDAMSRFYAFVPTGNAALGFAPDRWSFASVGAQVLFDVKPEKGPNGTEGPSSVSLPRFVRMPGTKAGSRVRMAALEKGMDNIRSLSADYPGKTLRAHWLLATAPFAVAKAKAGMQDVLEAVASSLGANLETIDGGYKLEPIPEVFKKRVVNTWAHAAKLNQDKVEKARDEVASALIESLKVADVTELFETQTGKKTVEAKPGTALFSKAWNIARAFVASGASSAAETARYRETLDAGQPVQLVYEVGSGVTAGFRDSRGKVQAHF